MGEQPIFSCKAHVFHIDPKTKRSWIPASASAVSVSFFYDSTRNLHRIISVEGIKAVINSTITPNMMFTKTSQKFGQWSDVRANTVYGLGFGTEAELNKFIEKFQEIKEATRHAPTSSATNGTSSTPTTSANASPVIARAVKMDQVDSYLPPPPAGEVEPKQGGGVLHQRSHSLTGLQQPSESPKHEPKVEKTLPTTAGAPAASSAEAQLKYENDRLKLALAQSSANAKKWEVELTTLKTNNARLTAALQESTANVEEWKLQLQSYKEENGRLRGRVMELEAGRGGDTAELSREVHQLRIRAEKFEADCKRKEEENRKLAASAGDPTAKAAHEETVKALEGENEQLRGQLQRLQDQLEMALSAQESQHKVLDTLNVQLGDKIAQLQGIHTELHQAIQT